MTGHKQITLVPGSGSGVGFAIATTLAQAGHIVYASLRLGQPEAEKRSAAILDETEKINLRIVDLDVLSEASCRAAVDHILAEHGRIDIVVNNAGMLMTGITEAFDPDQFQRIFDTNATCWLRVNRAVLPAMRRQRSGTLVYVGSTTAHLAEPFLSPYAAAKAAGEDLAEIMGMEARPFGIETVIIVPGAFTKGAEHFAHAVPPAFPSIVAQCEQTSRLGRHARGATTGD